MFDIVSLVVASVMWYNVRCYMTHAQSITVWLSPSTQLEGYPGKSGNCRPSHSLDSLTQVSVAPDVQMVFSKWAAAVDMVVRARDQGYPDTRPGQCYTRHDAVTSDQAPGGDTLATLQSLVWCVWPRQMVNMGVCWFGYFLLEAISSKSLTEMLPIKQSQNFT